MKVVKINKVLKFKQSDWLKKFVMFNTEKRMCAVNGYEKGLFKLMVNSVYGKTMENLRKRVSVKLVNNEKDYVKYVSRPTFVSQKILDKNFVAIHKVKPVLLLNKPIYVGFCVLDLTKLLMYDWHYNYFVSLIVACVLQILTVWCMGLGVYMMFMKRFMRIKDYLILVIIQKNQNFMIIVIKR